MSEGGKRSSVRYSEKCKTDRPNRRSGRAGKSSSRTAMHSSVTWIRTHGTSILDVKDPKHPKVIAEIEIPRACIHTRCASAATLCSVNLERYRSKEKAAYRTQSLRHFQPGKAQRDRVLRNQRGRSPFYLRWPLRLYLSVHMEGYVGRIPMILDLKDPTHPEEVGRWWMPGQWIGGGETPSWEGTAHPVPPPNPARRPALHSYWHGGFRDPGYRRHEPSEIHQRPQLVAAYLAYHTTPCRSRGSS